MKLEEAILIIKNEFPEFKLINAVDYSNYFVFSIAPKDQNIEKDGGWLGGLVAVDKIFGKTLSFNPLQHNISEYAKATKNNITYF